ncbi:DUF3987 domain-containing protein [Reyranella sp. CPCC 100927]|uniref:DUF3987 domain-containing protein n=1 Tax=Reyranella sp. CPCC 100927 TaxID=2599616 RepID=UPI0011B601C7|nr:DUF3987 domain-containing protein [Reyranella sp. CPCC 100927]TWS97292.1 DUF3987 domain-containing protein [Reyranella sp. CPCC 100927]
MLDRTNATSIEADADWDEPDLTLLGARHGDLPAFPVALLPRFWRDWCQRAAAGKGVAVDYVALPLLAAAASLLGAKRYVSPVPAWVEPCVLWTALVGEPSSGKTSGLAAAVALTRALDDDWELAAAGRRRYVTDLETARAERWWWREAVRGAVANHKPSPAIPPEAHEPQPFVPRQCVVDEPGIDAVAAALRGRRGGVLLAPESLAGWLTAMAHDVAGASDRSRWLKAWSADSWKLDGKAPADTVLETGRCNWIPCTAVSITGTIETDAIAAMLAGHDGGLGARFLFTWPGRPPLQPLSDAAVGRDADWALARLRDLPDVTHILPLTTEARALFEDFRRTLDAHAERLDGAEAAWWGRGASNVLRLAGVWTFLDWSAQFADPSEPPVVAAPALEAAIALWTTYLWPHAGAVLGAAGTSDTKRQARRALLWIRGQSLAQVSRDDLWRHARVAPNASGVDGVIETLIAGRWLRRIVPAEGVGRPRLRWAVNPALSCDAQAFELL